MTTTLILITLLLCVFCLLVACVSMHYRLNAITRATNDLMDAMSIQSSTIKTMHETTKIKEEMFEDRVRQIHADLHSFKY